MAGDREDTGEEAVSVTGSRGAFSRMIDPDRAERVQGGTVKAGHPARRYTAWAMGVLLVLIGLLFAARANGSDVTSAPQAIQVYAEGLFYAMIVIGIGIGVYIGSRADE